MASRFTDDNRTSPFKNYSQKNSARGGGRYSQRGRGRKGPLFSNNNNISNGNTNLNDSFSSFASTTNVSTIGGGGGSGGANRITTDPEWKEILENFRTSKNQNANKALDTLNAQTYPNQAVSDQDCIELIVALCRVIEPKQDLVASKLCQLIATLSVRQEISYGITEGEEIVSYLLRLVRNTHTWLRVDALRALSYVLYDLAPRCSANIQQSVLESVARLAQLSESDVEVRRQAINCLGNLCARTAQKMSLQYYNAIFSILYPNFENYAVKIFEDVALYKILSSVIRALQHIVSEGKTIHVNRTAQTISYLTRLMFFGTSIYPAPQSTQHPKERVSAHSHYPSSDSESDNEMATIDRETVRVRVQALNLLCVMARVDPKTITTYWEQLLPVQGSTAPRPFTPTLSTVLLYDPSPRVRSLAAQTIAALLDKTQFLLKQAEEPKPTSRSSGFTARSHILTFMIRELHTTLIEGLTREKSGLTLVQIVKCLAVLIENTPYEKLSSLTVLTGIIAQMMRLIDSSERTIQSAALSCLAAAFGTRTPTEQITTFLTEEQMRPSPNLVQTLLRLMETREPVIARTESAQVLINLARNYPFCLRPEWFVLLDRLVSALKSHEQALRLAAVQVIHNFTTPRHMTASAGGGDDDMEESQDQDADHAASGTGTGTTHGHGDDDGLVTKEMWIQIVDGILSPAMNDKFHSVRATGCMTYSNIHSSIFEALSERHKAIIPIVLGAANDEAPSVRASACKTLGVFVSFECLREDTFIMDVVEVLEPLLSDSTLNVRVRACWALANLCDCLRKSRFWLQDNPEEGGGDVDATASASAWHIVSEITNLSIKASKDNDKVRSNAVRALGNIAKLSPREFLESGYPSIMEQQITTTTTTTAPTTMTTTTTTTTTTVLGAILSELVRGVRAKSVKVRWNSCYALGNVIGSEEIMERGKDYISKQAIETLCSAVSEDGNFKVRIQAASALAAPPKREYYGQTMELVWRSLLQAVENADSHTDFKNYKYSVALVTQLQSTLLHVVSISTEEDLAAVRNEVLSTDKLHVLEQVYNKIKKATTTTSSSSSSNVPADDNNDAVAITTTTTNSNSEAAAAQQQQQDQEQKVPPAVAKLFSFICAIRGDAAAAAAAPPPPPTATTEATHQQ